MKKIKSLLAIVLSFFVSSEAFAVGGAAFGNEVLSARSLGQGAVGIAAQNGDPATVYSNPAGLTQLPGTQVTFGTTYENLHGYYQSDGTTSSKMRSIDVAVPNFAVTHTWMDGKLGSGIGLMSTYGLETHWPGDGPLRYVTTNTRLRMIMLTPGVAYQIHPTVSVGVGADYVNAFDASLEKHVSVDIVNLGLQAGGLPASPLGASDANSKLSGSGSNWGYHAGALYQPNEQHAIGLAYHSKIKLRIDGSVQLTGLSGQAAGPFAFGGTNYTTSAFTDVFLPQNVQLGYAYKPTEQWTLEADAAWYDWFSSRELNIRYPDLAGLPATDPKVSTLNTGNPIPQTWRDVWSVATGANYKYSTKMQLRGGFWYEPWAAPESTFRPDVMDLSRYGVTAGVGYAFTPAWSFDFAYNAIFFHNRHISNAVGFSSSGIPAGTPGLPNPDISGLYSNFVNLAAANLTYKF